MNQSTIYCEFCGYKLKDNWVYCVNCSKNRLDFVPKRCSHCGSVINDPQPVFCPFCQTKIGIEAPIIQESIVAKAVVQKKPERVSLLERKEKLSKISIKSLISNYVFNTQATADIMNTPSFTFIGLILIILAGFSFAISSFIFSSFLDKGIFLWRTFIGNIISQIVILVLIGLCIYLILSLLQFKVGIQHFIRLMGSYAPLFIVKDLLLLAISFYISFFNAGNINIGGMLITATLIVQIFVFVHLSATTKTITQLGLSISILLVIISYIMVLTFAGGYLQPFAEVIYSYFI